tara:strand:+ start:27 stop:185 length:159 start_codon:yes stop_codon:yes gene_type:complete
MKKELKETVFKILGYAMDALKYEHRGDEHYKVSLSLLKHTAQDLLYSWEEEE